MRVCIDPGHNNTGADTGSQGNGLNEGAVTLAIASRLKPLLEHNGIEVVMTRESDFVSPFPRSVIESLQTRVNIANNAKVDLFVSIHINAGGGTGVEVLIMGTGGRAEIAAKKVLPHLVKAGSWVNRGVKTQNAHVLRETTMPAILTENGFIDSASDSAKLKGCDFLQTLAVAHAKGICEYFGLTYKGEAQKVVVAPVVEDKDIYLSVRVRTSKADALVKQIQGMGYATKVMDLA